MTPITELLLQGGSHCHALHLEVPRLRLGGGQPGWTSGAEPIVHKDETLSCLIYLSVELKFFPVRNQAHSSRWRRPCVTFYLNSQTSAFCSIGLRFTCLFLTPWGPLHLKSVKFLNAVQKRRRNTTQASILRPSFHQDGFHCRLALFSFVHTSKLGCKDVICLTISTVNPVFLRVVTRRAADASFNNWPIRARRVMKK